MKKYSLENLLKTSQQDYPFNIKIIKRTRILEPTKVRQNLSDHEKDRYLSVTERNGFYHVPADESVIFYSQDSAGNCLDSFFLLCY